MYGKINDVNLEVIEQIVKRWQGNECSECTKEPKACTCGCMPHAKKKIFLMKLPFDVSNLNLETIGMDLLHCLCGSF